MKRVSFKSIGCRTNQQEIESLGRALEQEGFTVTTRHGNADIIVVNTCSVTGVTESKTRRLLQSLSRNYGQAKLCVTGCLAQQSPKELLAIERVCWVVGNRAKNDIPSIIQDTKGGLYGDPLDKGELDSVALSDTPITTFADAGRTRFALKVQEGCDFRCSYCIVPLLRGASRSVSSKMVVLRAKRVLDAGYKEIVITGTHIGQYADNRSYGLVSLLEELLTITGDFRIRLSSLDPRDCTDNLLQLFINEERLCKQMHLSVQSLSIPVLTGMNRMFPLYETFVKRLHSIKDLSPSCAIGGDFIVGFPGETEEMFFKTMEMVKYLGFNYGHVFRYSKRPGTDATNLPDQVLEKEKTERSEILRDTLMDLRSRFIEKQIEDKVIQRIIIEKESPCTGITGNYIRVVLPDITGAKNSWQLVQLEKYVPEKNSCLAKPVIE